MLVADRAEPSQEIQRREHVAAAPLGGFDEDAPDRPRLDGLPDLGVKLLQARGRTIRERPAFQPVRRAFVERAAVTGRIRQDRGELAELTAERLAESRQPADAQRAVPEAVVRAGESDHAGLAAVEQRGLQRRLDRLEARVRQDRLARLPEPASVRDRAQFLAEPHLEFRRVHIAHAVDEPGRLRDHRSAHRRRAVAQPRDGEGGGEIEEAVAVGVPHVGPFRALPEHGELAVHVRDVARFGGLQTAGQLARARSGNLGDDGGQHRRDLPRQAVVERDVLRRRAGPGVLPRFDHRPLAQGLPALG